MNRKMPSSHGAQSKKLQDSYCTCYICTFYPLSKYSFKIVDPEHSPRWSSSPPWLRRVDFRIQKKTRHLLVILVYDGTCIWCDFVCLYLVYVYHCYIVYLHLHVTCIYIYVYPLYMYVMYIHEAFFVVTCL